MEENDVAVVKMRIAQTQKGLELDLFVDPSTWTHSDFSRAPEGGSIRHKNHTGVTSLVACPMPTVPDA